MNAFNGKNAVVFLDFDNTIAPSFYITEKEMDLGTNLFEEALSKAIKNS